MHISTHGLRRGVLTQDHTVNEVSSLATTAFILLDFPILTLDSACLDGCGINDLQICLIDNQTMSAHLGHLMAWWDTFSIAASAA